MVDVPFFSELQDPRARNATHRLGDVVLLMVAASLCGQTTATDMALFAALRRPLLNRIVGYARAPSHDTFSRLLRLLDPVAFAAAFARFAGAVAAVLADPGQADPGLADPGQVGPGQVGPGQAGPGLVGPGQLGPGQLGDDPVALDGKALRRACDAATRTAPPMTVSAFATRTRLCLAARPCAGETAESEAEAALRVIELIDLAGRWVTADALHCHHRMAAALTAAGADYALALKRNRPAWLAAAKAAFTAADAPTAVTHARAHGRDERREAAVLPCAAPVAAGHAAWGRVRRSRNGKDAAPQYYLLSKPLPPARLLALARGHWAIENGLHWTLDVHLDEDAARARRDHAPANLALLKRIARNLLETADKTGVPISHRIRKCTFSDDYLIHAITHMR